MNISKLIDNVRQKEIQPRHFSYSNSACWYGEMLRNYAFDPDQFGNDTGCYSTFTVNPDFEQIDKTSPVYAFFMKKLFADILDVVPTMHVDWKQGIFVAWWWDGDGDLTVGEFTKTESELAILRAANNNDCKKDYTWLWLV